LGAPIGLRESDEFHHALEEISGRSTPIAHETERGRLVDAYVDGHKYVFGKRAVVYGEEDLVIGLTAFLAEIGVQPVLVASGGRSGKLAEAIEQVTSGICELPAISEGADFYDIAESVGTHGPDFMIGHSKGAYIAKRLEIPLVRVGFPIHDRFGGHRTLHLGYRGTLSLLDRIINALIETQQQRSPIGYSYI
jgi:nitrogenase molybdenum-iron protein NifN